VARMSTGDFEALYRGDPDPWSYASSAYEQAKDRATLSACGPGPFVRAIELGGSIGVFSALLAPRCRRLITVDAAPTAVARARARLAGRSEVTPVLGTIPDAIPHRTYDLVVASEILYYLAPARLEESIVKLLRCTRPGGRWVLVHWRPPGPERPLDAALIHARLRRRPELRHIADGATADYLLDVLERA